MVAHNHDDETDCSEGHCPAYGQAWFDEPVPKEEEVPQQVDDLARDMIGGWGLSAEEAARVLLEQTTGLKGDDHGKNTPKRFAAMLRELTTPLEYEFTTFPSEDDDMIVIHDIPFVSVCNHHVIPFVGKAWVGYIPNDKIVGLSKIVRVVQHFARSLQVQERLTRQVAEELMEKLDPAGVAVVMKAEHFCMTIRGVQTPGTLTTTSKMTGVFADHDRTAKAEFMQIIH